MLRHGKGKELTEHGNVGGAGDGSDPVQDLDDADHRQCPQRLAQRRTGNTELQAKLALGREEVAGLDGAGKELRAQEGEDFVEALAWCFLRTGYGAGHVVLLVVRPLTIRWYYHTLTTLAAAVNILPEGHVNQHPTGALTYFLNRSGFVGGLFR